MSHSPTGVQPLGLPKGLGHLKNGGNPRAQGLSKGLGPRVRAVSLPPKGGRDRRGVGHIAGDNTSIGRPRAGLRLSYALPMSALTLTNRKATMKTCSCIPDTYAAGGPFTVLPTPTPADEQRPPDIADAVAAAGVAMRTERRPMQTGAGQQASVDHAQRFGDRPSVRLMTRDGRLIGYTAPRRRYVRLPWQKAAPVRS